MARQVYEEQRKYGWPGLHKEVTSLCQELGIEDIYTTKMEKSALKRVLEAACNDINESELKNNMKGKTEKLKSEDCKMKEYMSYKSLKEVRDIFRSRTNLVEGFKGNFKNLYKNTNLNCVGCGQEVDDQTHATQCPAYDDLREGLNLQQDRDLVAFFRKVMQRRNNE